MSDTEKNTYISGDGASFSLSKFVGKKVVDILGYPADPFGGIPLFKINQIVFDDDSTVWVEGEHDVAYLSAMDEMQNMDQDTLQAFIDEGNEA